MVPGNLVVIEALRGHWAELLAGPPDLRLEILQVFSGYRIGMSAYCYQSGLDAAEIFWFDADDLAFRAVACHANLRMS